MTELEQTSIQQLRDDIEHDVAIIQAKRSAAMNIVRLEGVWFGTWNDRPVIMIDPSTATPGSMMIVDDFIRDVAGRRGDDERRNISRSGPVLVREKSRPISVLAL
jgi:hypothetical protein